MTTIDEVIQRDEVYKCDVCKEKFKVGDILYQDPIENFEILTPLRPFVFVDKNGIITGGSKMASKEAGDKVLCCPYCKEVHLFGFDKAE